MDPYENSANSVWRQDGCFSGTQRDSVIRSLAGLGIVGERNMNSMQVVFSAHNSDPVYQGSIKTITPLSISTRYIVKF